MPLLFLLCRSGVTEFGKGINKLLNISPWCLDDFFNYYNFINDFFHNDSFLLLKPGIFSALVGSSVQKKFSEFLSEN